MGGHLGALFRSIASSNQSRSCLLIRRDLFFFIVPPPFSAQSLSAVAPRCSNHGEKEDKNFFLLGQRTVPPAAPWSICIDTLFIMWARVCGEKSQVACQYLIRRQRRRLLRDFWSPSIRPRTRLWRIEGRVTKRRPPISMNMHIIAQVHIAGQHSKHCGPRSTSIFC